MSGGPDGVHSVESTTINVKEPGVTDVTISSQRFTQHSAIDAPTLACKSPALYLARLDLDEAPRQDDDMPVSDTPSNTAGYSTPVRASRPLTFPCPEWLNLYTRVATCF